MKTHLIAVLAGGLFYAAFASGADKPTAVTADRVSVFKAPLVCPAAPQIGCGSASKPILLDLEKQPGVLEAWLNRAGTRIAVVWKPESDAETRRKVVAELREDHATTLRRVTASDSGFQTTAILVPARFNHASSTPGC